MKSIIVSVIISIMGTLSQGFVIPIMWAWFVMPVFHLPAITFWYAIGISYTIQLLRPVFISINKEYLDDLEYQKRIIRHFCIQNLMLPWVILSFGWIAKCFIPS